MADCRRTFRRGSLLLTAAILTAAPSVRAVASASPSSAPPWGHGSFILIACILLSGLAVLKLIRHLKQNESLTSRENAALRNKTSRLEYDLKMARRRYRQILDNAGDAIFFMNPETGSLLEINKRAQELLGYSTAEAKALDRSVLLPGKQHLRYLRLVKKVTTEGYGEENMVFHCKSGRPFTGAVHARLGKLGDRTVVHCTLRDISQIIQIEQQLRRKNRELALANRIAHHAAAKSSLDTIVDSMLNEVVQTFDADGGGIYHLRHKGNELHLVAHRGIEAEVLNELRSLPPGEGLVGGVALSGKPSSSKSLQTDNRLWSKAIRKTNWQSLQVVPLATKERIEGVLFIFNRYRRLFSQEEIRLLLAIGQQIGTAMEGVELFEALRWQIRLTEASHRELLRSRHCLRKNLDQLELANRSMERLDQLKSNFLALASHELRTPLTCVLSGSELLETVLSNRLSAEESSILQAVRTGSKRLEVIVKDLLEVAQVESQSLYLASEPVDLANLINELVVEFQPASRERNLTLFVSPAPGSLHTKGDYQHLKKTFRRILENAFKFTPEGGTVEISIRPQSDQAILQRKDQLYDFSPSFFDQPPAGPFVQVSIVDNGIGIPAEDRINVFDKFFEVGPIQGHFTSRTRFGGKGVGLGLTLVKGMVEAHRGMVWVAPPEGSTQGSAFHVLLPRWNEKSDSADCPPGSTDTPMEIRFNAPASSLPCDPATELN